MLKQEEVKRAVEERVLSKVVGRESEGIEIAW